MNVPHSVMRAKATAMAAIGGVMRQSTRFAKYDEEVGRSIRSVVSSTDVHITGSTPRSARESSPATARSVSSHDNPNSSSVAIASMGTATDDPSGHGDTIDDMSAVQGLLRQQYMRLESVEAKRDFEDRWE